MILYNINKSLRLYYKEEIHLADGCSSPGSYSCFTLIISTCRVMDWECFLIQGQHHFLGSLFSFSQSPAHTHTFTKADIRHKHSKTPWETHITMLKQTHTRPHIHSLISSGYCTDTGVQPVYSAASWIKHVLVSGSATCCCLCGYCW